MESVFFYFKMLELATSPSPQAFSEAGLALPKTLEDKFPAAIPTATIFRLYWQAYLGQTDWEALARKRQNRSQTYVSKPIVSGQVFDQATYLTLNQNRGISILAEKADIRQRNAFLDLLEKVDHILIASGSHLKVDEVAAFIVRLTGLSDQVSTSTHPLSVEPSSSDTVRVAGHKAVFAHDSVANRLPPGLKRMVDETGMWLDWERLLEHRPVKNSLEVGKLAIGADVNFFWRGPDGIWHQEFKLDRLGRNLTEVEEKILHDQLKQIYCFSSNGLIEVIWPIAAVWINSDDSKSFWNILKIVSKPIDPELFEVCWQMAKADGKIYGTNPHFGLLECLREQGQIITMGILSNEEANLGLTITNKMMAPTPDLLDRAAAGVVGNRLMRGI